MLLLALAGCSDSDSDGASSSGTTSSGNTAVDGPAACAATCDKQLAPQCKQLTQVDYGSSCRALCGSAYKKVPAECKDKRALYDVCTRDRPTYSCTEAGGLSTQPSGACGNEANACAGCSQSAGLSCWGLF